MASPAIAFLGDDDMDEIEQQIALLNEFSHSELVVCWRKMYGSSPPKGISRRLLLLALAYRIQVEAYGALDSKTNRYLQAIAAGTQTAAQPLPALKPGMRLMREWNGRTHVVDVSEDGFLWNGEIHSSLSAIARAITGARWSGPRFFGLQAQNL